MTIEELEQKLKNKETLNADHIWSACYDPSADRVYFTCHSGCCDDWCSMEEFLYTYNNYNWT